MAKVKSAKNAEKEEKVFCLLPTPTQAVKFTHTTRLKRFLATRMDIDAHTADKMAEIEFGKAIEGGQIVTTDAVGLLRDTPIFEQIGIIKIIKI